VPSKLVVVVGAANMDIVARAHAPVLSGDSTPGLIACASGGVARNLAENLARLGHEPCLVSAVGDDVLGRSVLDTTRSAGVDVSRVVAVAGGATATYLSVHGPDGEMVLAVNDMALLAHLTPDVLQAHQAWLASAACLVLDCNLPTDTLGWLLNEVSKGPVWVEGVSVAKCARVAPWLNRIHTLKVNRLEAAALCGTPVDSVAQARSAALQLHLRGVEQVIVSLGALGVCWCDAQGECGFLAARSVQVVNASGAGDALFSGVLHGHLQGKTLAESMPLGLACAELTLRSPSANCPGLSSLALSTYVANLPVPATPV
jgi:pseudouridine kinase